MKMKISEETYEVSKDEAQTLNIEELVRYSSALTKKLRHANEQLSKQHMDLERLRNGKHSLRLELADANVEIGRLLKALTHEAEKEKEGLTLVGK